MTYGGNWRRRFATLERRTRERKVVNRWVSGLWVMGESTWREVDQRLTWPEVASVLHWTPAGKVAFRVRAMKRTAEYRDLQPPKPRQ